MNFSLFFYWKTTTTDNFDLVELIQAKLNDLFSYLSKIYIFYT